MKLIMLICHSILYIVSSDRKILLKQPIADTVSTFEIITIDQDENIYIYVYVCSNRKHFLVKVIFVRVVYLNVVKPIIVGI
jgi:hypothetical protein